MDGHKITNATKHLCSKKVSGAEEKKSRKLQKFLVDMCSDYLNPEKELKFLKLWCEVCGPVTFGIRPFHESYSPCRPQTPKNYSAGQFEELVLILILSEQYL